MAVCGTQCADLVLGIIRILGMHFSYNRKLKEGTHFCLVIADIQCVLKLQKLKNHTLEGKIFIFKTLVLSKITFHAFVTPIPNYVVTDIFMGEFNSEIKHNTLCNY